MASETWVVAGLGNPGSRYSKTRHNAGFLLLEHLVSKLSSNAPGSNLERWKTQFKAEVLSVSFADQKILLIKPQTFMNLSGESVQECLAFKKIAPERLVVVHDEIDIPFGTLRVKRGGGSGGHNGIKSITEKLSSPDYFRIRIGVGRPVGDLIPGDAKQQDVSSHVLSSFSSEEQKSLSSFLDLGVSALEILIKKGLEEAQRLYH